MTAVDVPAVGMVSARRTGTYRWGAISGIVFGPILLVSALMTAGMPHADNAAKVQTWMVKHTGLLTGASLLSVAGVIIGLFFLTWIYSLFTARQRSSMGTFYLAGTLIFAAAGAVSAGLNAAVGGDAKHLTSGSLQLMASLGEHLSYYMTCIGLACLYFAAGHLIRRTALLPGWLTWVSWVFAACAASVVLGFVALLGMLVWAVAVGVILATRAPVQS